MIKVRNVEKGLADEVKEVLIMPRREPHLLIYIKTYQ